MNTILFISALVVYYNITTWHNIRRDKKNYEEDLRDRRHMDRNTTK